MQHTTELLDSLGTVHSLYGDIALEFTEQTDRIIRLFDYYHTAAQGTSVMLITSIVIN